ncbi:50S ribosomal protein L6 [archaeon SCG-AAA382B04]|nr:50S ribosomal protein L6 [archaeon SCG-AAA382B04]
MAKKEIQIPEEVSFEIKNNTIKVEGENGKLEKEFKSPNIKIEKKNDKIILTSLTKRKEDKSQLGTFSSHLKNMLKGVQEDFKYKAKAVYSHFPIKIETNDKQVLIKNFIGEESPRKVDIIGEQTKVEVSGEELTIRGPDKEAVGQTAAKIEEETDIRGKDPRVFQDGIYVIERE